MRYYSYWIFLRIMFASSICFAVLSLIFLPKISIDQKNSINNDNKQRTNNINNNPSSTLCNDLRILFVNNTIYSTLFATILFQFIIWGIFYVTFGPFIQKLFNLNPAEFGVIS